MPDRPSPISDPIAVLGAGSWGTALAILIARNGHQVTLWGQPRDHMAGLAKSRENKRHLPGMTFPGTITVETDLSRSVKNTGQLLVAVPSRVFRNTLERIREVRFGGQQLVVAWGTKGLDPERSELLSEVVSETLGDSAARVVISGPSFAQEVAHGLPTALTVAADNPSAAAKVVNWLSNERVRVYTNDDMKGVQLGGAIKNVMAIAAGISDGLGYGANARAALITRGLAEMSRLGVALGGRQQTFMGLTGVGDLILTCTDDQSRNRRVGIGLGQGKPLDRVLAEIGQEAEGVATVHELYSMAKRTQVEMPITEQVYSVIYEARSPHTAVDKLFQRELRAE